MDKKQKKESKGKKESATDVQKIDKTNQKSQRRFHHSSSFFQIIHPLSVTCFILFCSVVPFSLCTHTRILGNACAAGGGGNGGSGGGERRRGGGSGGGGSEAVLEAMAGAVVAANVLVVAEVVVETNVVVVVVVALWCASGFHVCLKSPR